MSEVSIMSRVKSVIKVFGKKWSRSGIILNINIFIIMRVDEMFFD